jgi:hypothetical protein
VIAVAIRTSETTITFKQSFSLGTMDRPQPAGTYRLVMDDDEMPGISFVALRRIATFLHTPALSSPEKGKSEMFQIGASELAAALANDDRAHKDQTLGQPKAERQAIE